MVYTVRVFSSKCSLFHNSNLFGSCIIHTLYTGFAKIKKNNSGAKRLKPLRSAENSICYMSGAPRFPKEHCFLENFQSLHLGLPCKSNMHHDNGRREHTDRG